MKEVLGAFDGKTGHAVFTDRGGVLEFKGPDVRLPGQAGAVLQQFLNGLSDEAAALATPFPAEPVGVGARWRVTSSVTLSGIPMKMVAELTLTEVRGERVVATLTETLMLKPGPTEIAGTKATIKSGTLRGSGTVMWNLAGAAALGDQSIEGTSVMTIGSEGHSSKFEQFQRQHVVITER